MYLSQIFLRNKNILIRSREICRTFCKKKQSLKKFSVKSEFSFAKYLQDTHKFFPKFSINIQPPNFNTILARDVSIIIFLPNKNILIRTGEIRRSIFGRGLNMKVPIPVFTLSSYDPCVKSAMPIHETCISP